MTDAIVLRNVTKTFGAKTAVSSMDLQIPAGALYGFIGPNGAGKTTTIRIILSILFADSGEVEVLGHKSALEAKDRIGYLPEERGVYKKMRVGDFLLYMARLKGLDGPGLKARVREWLERVGLGETEMKRCDELSKGMQQKVQFIGAVIHHPDLIILDEPFSGLDPVSARQLRQLVMDEHKRGATILFSTHVMANAEQLCDHVVMIHGGQKVMDSGLTAIRNAQGIRGLWFEPLDGRADVQALRNVRGVKRVDREGSAYQITLNDGTDPGAALQEVVAAMPAARIELHRPTLEDIFIEIVGGRGEDIGQLREKLRNGGAVAEVRS